MRATLILLAVATLLMMLGCTGDEPTEVDTKPPWKPDLLHHLGDTGDGTSAPYTVEYPGGPITNTVELNDENNGIDAVPDDNWLRIQWAPLVDNDIDFIKVYRYRRTVGEPEPVLVDSVRFEEQESYVDQSLNQSAINSEWFYFIDVFDRAGNHTVSDTVGYRLMEKVLMDEPLDNTTVASGADITFQWQILTTGSVSMYRVLLFSEDIHGNLNYLWHYDETDTDPQGNFLTKEYDGDVLSPGTYYWRVDVLTNESFVDAGSEAMLFQLNVD